MKPQAFANSELSLLIKSRYPLIFVEAIDEQYVLQQLVLIAGQFELNLYEWSMTQGLRRRLMRDPYPDTFDPEKALRCILSLLSSPPRNADALFVLKDFERHLGEAVVVRLFKDLVNAIRGTKTTMIIVAPQYSLPPEIEADSARIVAGYPTEAELVEAVSETLGRFAEDRGAPEIALTEDEERRMVLSLRGLSLQQVRNVVGQCLQESPRVDAAMIARAERIKKRIFDRDGLLEYCGSEDAGGLAGFANLKQWLAERKGSFHRASSVLPAPKGVLIMGVQGCGKSLATKVIASELGLPLYRLDLVRFYSKYIGETEQNLRKALQTVDKLAPICLWIDELEKNFASSAGDIDGGVSQRILGTFLTWMQERTSACFIAATANEVDNLPPEFLRKGRFDEAFFVDLPGEDTRRRLFEIHIQRRGFSPEPFGCGRLAALTPDFSGAEIEQAVIAALYRATGRREPLTAAHLEEEIGSTKPLAVLKSEDIAALRAWARDRTVPV